MALISFVRGSRIEGFEAVWVTSLHSCRTGTLGNWKDASSDCQLWREEPGIVRISWISAKPMLLPNFPSTHKLLTSKS